MCSKNLCDPRTSWCRLVSILLASNAPHFSDIYADKFFHHNITKLLRYHKRKTNLFAVIFFKAEAAELDAVENEKRFPSSCRSNNWALKYSKSS